MKGQTATSADRKAAIVLHAMVKGDESALDKFEVSGRTLRRYRQQIESDPKLAEAVQRLKDKLEEDWAQSLPGAIRACLSFLAEAPEQLVPSPEAVHAVAGAMKLLTEVADRRRILDARLASQARQVRGESGQATPPGTTRH